MSRPSRSNGSAGTTIPHPHYKMCCLNKYIKFFA